MASFLQRFEEAKAAALAAKNAQDAMRRPNPASDIGRAAPPVDDFFEVNAPPEAVSGGGGFVAQAPPSGVDTQLWKRITSALAAAQSTDDPSYWYGVITKDPNGAGSAWDYWVDRINRGDGALAVREGRVSRVDDSPSGGMMSDPRLTGGLPDDLLSSFGLPASPYGSQPFGESYTTPAVPTGLQTPYALPTQAELEASPGYMARLKLGEQGVQRNAAAQGTVLSGGTQKALERYRQDYGSNEYGNLVGQTLGARNQNVGEYQNLVGNTQTQYANRYGQYLGENARTLSDYLTNFGIRNKVSGDWWSQSQQFANRGLQAATNSRPS